MNGQRNESLIENISMNEAEVNSLVEKYDQESRYRKLFGWQGIFITILQWVMVLFGIIYKSLARRSIPLRPFRPGSFARAKSSSSGIESLPRAFWCQVSPIIPQMTLRSESVSA